MHSAAVIRLKAVTAAVGVFLLAVLVTVAAEAQEVKTLKGVALIIGQSHYAHVTPLANPSQDARTVDGLLTGLGFDTRSVTDRDADKLKRDLDRFVEDAEYRQGGKLSCRSPDVEMTGKHFADGTIGLHPLISSGTFSIVNNSPDVKVVSTFSTQALE